MSGVRGVKRHVCLFACVEAWLVGVREGVTQERQRERGRGEREEGKKGGREVEGGG